MSSTSSRVNNRERDKVLTPHSRRILAHHPARLKWRRQAAGLSQEQLGELAGYTKQHIWGLENSKFSASAECLAALAEALKCKTTDIMPDEPSGAVA
jgi:transcriptional regulator with XRE-family HTH domain